MLGVGLLWFLAMYTLCAAFYAVVRHKWPDSALGKVAQVIG